LSLLLHEPDQGIGFLKQTLDETLFDDNTHTYYHLVLDPEIKKIGVAWGMGMWVRFLTIQSPHDMKQSI
jgi:hypothetical protein